MTKGRILSGMRPTGKLHIGHLSVLENWVNLQNEYDCNFMVADWHALTSSFEDTSEIKNNIKEMVIDWLSVGLDPEKSTIFVQSHVKEHAELHLLLSMITPLGWLERVPTFKDQIQQLGQQGKDISTYGFLGYPLLMSADIMVYRGNVVPVGEDQIPHLEFTREISRRFNHMFQTDLFPEPQPLLAKVSLLPGVDGRKMSKSYANDIAIGADEDIIWNRVRAMVTDPQRVRRNDPGDPDVCMVYKYKGIYYSEILAEIEEGCKAGKIGCMECKKNLSGALNRLLSPIREKRLELEAKPDYIEQVIKDGAEKARTIASETLQQVRETMKI